MLSSPLKGWPGVKSKRWAGIDSKHPNFEELLLTEFLRRLEGLSDRRAKFIDVAYINLAGEKELFVSGELYGEIVERTRGNHGWVYDKVFQLTDETCTNSRFVGKTLGELTPEEKNLISHRTKAFIKVVDIVKSFLMEQLLAPYN
jgi:XTP/dITP diphosphohydrolase